MAAKLARFSWLPGALAAAVLIALGRLVYSTSSAPLELEVYDRVMNASESAASRDIVIVAIDDASIARLGPWPWPHDMHTGLLERLRSDGATVVAFTTPFDGPRGSDEQERVRAALALLESSELGNSQQARQLRKLLSEASGGRDPNVQLARAIAAHGNVVLPVDIHPLETGGTESGETANMMPHRFAPGADPSVLRRASGADITQLPPADLLASASAIGHSFVRMDADGTVRTDIAAVRVGTQLLPSLATSIAARAVDAAPNEVAFHSSNVLSVRGRRVVLDSNLNSRPHYVAASGPQSFQQYAYWQVLGGEVPPAQLQGKVVLIGFTGAVAGNSLVATPIDKSTPRVVATASGVSSLLTQRAYSRPTYTTVVEWAVALLVIAFAALALPSAGAAIGGAATALFVIALVGTEIMALRSSHLWLRFMLPSVALVAGYGVYLVAEVIRRANTRAEPRDAGGNLRALGQTFQKQGQLDLAFETYQRCPLDAPTMELLYDLGLDFERRRQISKASAVYSYIATRDANYRDLRARRARVQRDETPAPKAEASVLPRPAAAAVRREPPAQKWHSSSDGPATRPLASPTGPTLGRYEIERELGKGAMGIVYLGRDPKINRVVAIKAIPLAEEFEEDDLAEARARFFREAEMAGRLNHPAIVTVYDAGEDHGLAYIAMEYLRGQHLSHYTAAERLLPPKNVMVLVARVADALHYAHRQNVVHRDIKPANIMFDPDTDELKITDFGIARLTDTSRTKTGIVLGTPSFMSPEQLEGRALDGRSDQFALGVSLYQLLSGHLPFRAESMPRLMQKIATEAHAPIRLVRPDLPAALEPIIERVLAKSADERYANCAELAAALRACAGPAEAPREARTEHEWLLP